MGHVLGKTIRSWRRRPKKLGPPEAPRARREYASEAERRMGIPDNQIVRVQFGPNGLPEAKKAE